MVSFDISEPLVITKSASINVSKKEKVYSILSTLFIFIPLITEGIFILICKILAG